MRQVSQKIKISVDEILEKYDCPICMCKLTEPFITKCGHSFCKVGTSSSSQSISYPLLISYRHAYQNVSIDSMSAQSAEPSLRLTRYSRTIPWRHSWLIWKKKRPRSSRDTSITLLAMLLINPKTKVAFMLTSHPLRQFLHWTFVSPC